MRILFPTFLAALLVVGITGVTPAHTIPTFAVAKEVTQPSHDYCLMKDGRMMIIRSGKLLPMTETMTMRDGTVCRTNGSCTRKDGTVIQMKEGEHMMKNGQIMKNPFIKKRPA